LAATDLAGRLRAGLGPWPVSGPALVIGNAALWDWDWIEETRLTLGKAAPRLNTLLEDAGLESVGRTELFNLVRSPDAQKLFDRLGRAGILVRRFAEEPERLRFGLPGAEADWRRLEDALRR
jgi:cobalamin biosynthetic protein CobC